MTARHEGSWAWVRMLPEGEWEAGRFTLGHDGWRIYLTNAEGSFNVANFEVGEAITPPPPAEERKP